MAKQTEAMIDIMDNIRLHGYARTTDLNGYKKGHYSAKTASRVFRELRENGYVTKESEAAHTYYPTDKLTRFERPEL